mmetsp:Transcript_4965/g.7356  ORF Transcript_4965/g.7356 Transcript_4965/m.7356 type:complete len:215 (+) Transcript_4965:47-691(+)
MGNSNNKEDPVDLEMLSISTGLSEKEVNRWYEAFMKENPTGRIYEDQFVYDNMVTHGEEKAFWTYIFKCITNNLHDSKEHKPYITFTIFLKLFSIGRKKDNQKEDAYKHFIFDLFDLSGNKKIELKELKAILNTYTALTLFQKRSMIHHKKLDDQALQQLKKKVKERSTTLFSHLDVNTDGKLDFEEFVRGYQSFEEIAGQSLLQIFSHDETAR